MIEKKTVFILGAGASHPYDYPLGYDLTVSIIDGLEAGQAMFETLAQADFSRAQMRSFQHAFRRSGKYSIDSFLQHRKDLSEIGRAAIAYQIMSKEDPARLYAAPRDRDWYRHLVSRMDAPASQFEKNAVSFITFNYDRSLQYYLVQHLAGSHKLHDDIASSIVAKFPFIHLHGDVGLLPGFGRSARRYDSQFDPDEVRACASRIHIVYDELADREASFKQAKVEIESAERIVMLGLGFDRTNLERLGLNQTGKPVWATCMGLTDLERSEVEQFCQGRLGLWNNTDCLAAFRQNVSLT